MEFNEYQKQAKQTAVYPDIGRNLPYTALGLASEAGEIAGKVKKIMRDWGGVMTDEMRARIKEELGDALWYVAMAAFEIRETLDGVAAANITKLSARQTNGTLHGDGDHR